MNKYNFLQKLSISKQILIGSMLCFIYFLMQFFLHYYKVDTILAGVLTEIITIPFLLLLVALFFASIWFLFSKKETQKSILYLSLLILGATVVTILAI
jgi:hypothetical protein